MLHQFSFLISYIDFFKCQSSCFLKDFQNNDFFSFPTSNAIKKKNNKVQMKGPTRGDHPHNTNLKQEEKTTYYKIDYIQPKQIEKRQKSYQPKSTQDQNGPLSKQKLHMHCYKIELPHSKGVFCHLNEQISSFFILLETHHSTFKKQLFRITVL